MKRKGFSLVIAIIILVVVSSLAALMLSLSSSSSKQTADIYLKEQADLLMQSATEYSMLAILGHDNQNSCVENINITYPNSSNPIFDINVSLWYIIDSTMPAGFDCNHVISNNLSTHNSNMTVLIDTTVTTAPNINISEPIKLHRRTVQKP